VKRYREELYSSIVPIVEKHASAAIASELSTPQEDGSDFDEHKREELKRIIVEVLSEIGSERSIMHLSSRVHLSRHSVEKLLFQLSQENVVRIDREKGSTKKTYSLVNSSENRLIDTFIGTLNEDVILDERFIRRRHHELDAMVRTSSGCYAVEAVLAFKRLSRERIERSVSRLSKAKKEMGLEEATSVLLVGISTNTVREDINLIKLEKDGIFLKFIEIE
jgi:predicted ArsR family transcriptional regulator